MALKKGEGMFFITNCRIKLKGKIGNIYDRRKEKSYQVGRKFTRNYRNPYLRK